MRLAIPLALLSLSGVLGSQPTVRLADTGAVVSGYYKTNAAGGQVQVFQGIPYAEPRVGKQRFTQTKVQALTRDLNATAHGSICYGAPRLDAASGQYPPSEDCLYLNVYAPAGATRASKLPVMVWVHGGGFIAGAANPYDGTDLVGVGEQDVVVVTFNYRLSVFGYLSNKEVLAHGDGANFGMRDQEVAFAWVQKYIADFGGDPADVTAVGESAGSISLALHMVSRDGKQTWFNKAIMQSGGYGSSSDSNAKQEEVKVALAKAVGCPTDASLDCLRTIDAAKLFAAADPLNGWFPTVDGVYLYDQPIRRVLAGKVSRIPTISGTNTDDGYYFSLGGGSDNAATFNSYLQTTYPLLTSLDLSLIGSLYPEKDFASAQLRASELRNDQMFVCPSELLSLSLSVTTPAYRYRFNDGSNRTFGIPLVLHAEDLNYVFNRTAQLPATPTSHVVTRYIMKFWTNFIRFGNPNGKPQQQQQQQQQQSTMRTWPTWDALAQQQIVLQEPLTAERSGAYTNQHAARCAFWYSYDLRAAAGAAVPLKK